MRRTNKNIHQPTVDNTTTPPTSEGPRRFNVFIGIDNGVTGTIGIIVPSGSYFYEIPVKKEQNYTKKKGNISRVVGTALKEMLAPFVNSNTMIQIERPMVNPGRFAATTSALRALEAVLIVVEQLGLAYEYIDSKEWQKVLLPQGSKKEQLKEDSKNIGCRLFPQHRELIEKHKDADGILIAEFCRRKFH